MLHTVDAGTRAYPRPSSTLSIIHSKHTLINIIVTLSIIKTYEANLYSPLITEKNNFSLLSA